jgi:predicted RNA-binding protein Jag
MWYNKDTNAITLYGKKDVLEDAKKHVCKVIEGYVKKFSTEFIENIYNTNTMDETCTEVSLDNHYFNKEDIKHLIGSDGSNLKDITKKSNTYFIWYNTESHSIQIWGTKYHTLNAIKILQLKINKVRDVMNKHEAIEQEPLTKKQKTI